MRLLLVPDYDSLFAEKVLRAAYRAAKAMSMMLPLPTGAPTGALPGAYSFGSVGGGGGWAMPDIENVRPIRTKVKTIAFFMVYLGIGVQV